MMIPMMKENPMKVNLAKENLIFKRRIQVMRVKLTRMKKKKCKIKLGDPRVQRKEMSTGKFHRLNTSPLIVNSHNWKNLQKKILRRPNNNDDWSEESKGYSIGECNVDYEIKPNK